MARESWEVQLLEHYIAHAIEWSKCLKHVRSLIEIHLVNRGVDVVEIKGRVKSFESCVEKARRYQWLKDVPEEEHLAVLKAKFTDFVGLRVVCFYSDDIEKVIGLLKTHFCTLRETNKIEELEESESAFGYRAHHVDLRISDKESDSAEFQRFGGIRFEVQVRTIVQEAWTVLQNKLVYKKPTSKSSRRKLATLAAAFESIDHDFIELREQVGADQAIAHLPVEAKPQETRDETDLFVEVSNLFSGREISAALWQRLMIDLDHLDPNWKPNELVAGIARKDKELTSFFSAYPEFVEKPAARLRILLYALNPMLYRPIISIAHRRVFDLWRSGSEKAG